MHIAIITGGYSGLSGVHTHVRQLSIYLRKKGLEASVLASDVDNEVTREGIRLIKVPRPRILPQIFFYFFKLINLNSKHKIDCLFVTDSIAYIAAIWLRKLYGTPITFSLQASIFSEGRDLDYPPLQVKLLRFSNRLVAQSADKVICISKEMIHCAVYAGATKDKIVYLQNPVILDSDVPPAVDQNGYCLYVGALRPNKGVEYFIKAIPAIIGELPNFKAIIVGDGSERASLGKLVDELGLNDHVQFVGFVPHEKLHEYYKHSSVFVMPSLNEPQGIVALEAMTFGLPVVASNVGGIPEMVTNGFNGELVPSKDPRALADAVIEILTDENLLKTMSQNARESVTSFSWDRKIEEFINVFQMVSRRS